MFDVESKLAPTYEAIGATAGKMPTGYHHDELSVVLGSGRELFDRCGELLDNWGLQKSMGFGIYPRSATVEDGQTILLSLRVLGVRFTASCRVIYKVNEDRRHGFAYGTLPTHPETGEEYFGVRLDDDDNVHFEIRAFSRPRQLLARLGGPITRRAQLAAMHRYCTEMRSFADNFRQAD